MIERYIDVWIADHRVSIDGRKRGDTDKGKRKSRRGSINISGRTPLWVLSCQIGRDEREEEEDG